MNRVSLVPVDVYHADRWVRLVNDIHGLIEDGLDHLPNFVDHEARKYGFTPIEGQAARYQAWEEINSAAA